MTASLSALLCCRGDIIPGFREMLQVLPPPIPFSPIPEQTHPRKCWAAEQAGRAAGGDKLLDIEPGWVHNSAALSYMPNMCLPAHWGWCSSVSPRHCQAAWSEVLLLLGYPGVARVCSREQRGPIVMQALAGTLPLPPTPGWELLHTLFAQLTSALLLCL